MSAVEAVQAVVRVEAAAQAKKETVLLETAATVHPGQAARPDR